MCRSEKDNNADKKLNQSLKNARLTKRDRAFPSPFLPRATLPAAGFFACEGMVFKALGQAGDKNGLLHNILCSMVGFNHNILHFKCFRIMDLGVVKYGCFLIQTGFYGASRGSRFLQPVLALIFNPV